MIRYSLLAMVITFICVYGFRDWFKALCLLIPLIAVLERPDMPRSIMGISGLNPYNIALAFIMLAFLLDKTKLGKVRFPPMIVGLSLSFGAVFAFSFYRGITDLDGLHELMDFARRPRFSMTSIAIDYMINPIRFVIPGFLLAMGIWNSERLRWAVWSYFALGSLLALQILIRMTPALLGADDLADRALRVLNRDIGFHRVEASTFMALFTAAAMATWVVGTTKTERTMGLLATGPFLLALALTGGRAGLLAGVATCGLLTFMKKPKLFFVAPFILLPAIPLVPGLQDRMLEGFVESESASYSQGEEFGLTTDGGQDLYAITSGRALVWPMVWDQFLESPVIGEGRDTMRREGLTLSIAGILGDHRTDFAHPHNAYLEVLIDNGVLGAIPIFWFFGLITLWAFRDFRRSEDPDLRLLGGLAFAGLVTFYLCCVGSGSFYPQLRTVPLWCTIGLYLGAKFALERQAAAAGEPEPVPTEAQFTAESRESPLWNKGRGSDRWIRSW